ncbi:TetR/AcrR family transcriptional regulator [uncultured Robinsoniella sp.]|uniref:TetR/AcrR family transcriptional regulator n=1 Tax=uncultured Robinsoniella sp. TaxID=904190 RepID=UPI00374E223B
MPKQKITKQIILDSAFKLLRFSGHEAVNARSVAKSTGCSVQPIYSYYENMSELMQELFAYTQQFLSQYIEKNASQECYFESIGKCHIRFAKDEKYLFRFLYLSEYMNAASFEDIIRQCTRDDVTESIMNTLNLSAEESKKIYLNMILYTHGIASMIATGAADIPNEDIHRLTDEAFRAFLDQSRKEA